MALPIENTPVSTPVVPMRRTYWGLLFKWVGLVTLFWLVEVLYSYYFVQERSYSDALVLGSAFAGATFFSLSLLLSVLFKFWPRLAVRWRIRRYLGVAAFVALAMHGIWVWWYLFGGSVSGLFFSWNPISNPILLGMVAMPILLAMAATSTDWAVRKLGSRAWKTLHRFVYVAYAVGVLHFLFQNPPSLWNLAGYVLLVVTGCAIVGQLYLWIRYSSKRKFMNAGFWVGLCLVMFFSWLFIQLYRLYNAD